MTKKTKLLPVRMEPGPYEDLRRLARRLTAKGRGRVTAQDLVRHEVDSLLDRESDRIVTRLTHVKKADADRD